MKGDPYKEQLKMAKEIESKKARKENWTEERKSVRIES